MSQLISPTLHIPSIGGQHDWAPPVLVLGGVDFERDVSGRRDKVVLFHYGSVREYLSPEVEKSCEDAPYCQSCNFFVGSLKIGFGLVLPLNARGIISL